MSNAQGGNSMMTTMILLCSGQKAMIVEGDSADVEAFRQTIEGKGKEMDIRQAVHTLYLMDDVKSFEEAKKAWEGRHDN